MMSLFLFFFFLIHQLEMFRNASEACKERLICQDSVAGRLEEFLRHFL